MKRFARRGASHPHHVLAMLERAGVGERVGREGDGETGQAGESRALAGATLLAIGNVLGASRSLS
jgi:hypothetical protein